jgi:hypothetical protein
MFAFSPGGLISGGFMAAEATFLDILVEENPEHWFSVLASHEDARAVNAAAASGQPDRFEMIYRFADEDVERQMVIVCPRVGKRLLCVKLEYRLDDSNPAEKRALHARLLASLRPLESPEATVGPE